MNTQIKKRLERLELESRKSRERETTTLDVPAFASALAVALRDYPEELAETFAHLSSGRLGDARDVLEHLTTGKEDDHTLSPRTVGGVIHLLMHGTLDTRENIADRIREPLTEYTNSEDLQESIVLLLYDLTGNAGVFRDHIVAFACMCMNGVHGFRIDGRQGKSLQ
jgi:hypothetical protein